MGMPTDLGIVDLGMGFPYTSVEEKKADYLKKWNVMLPQDRAELVLHAEDGVATP